MKKFTAIIAITALTFISGCKTKKSKTGSQAQTSGTYRVLAKMDADWQEFKSKAGGFSAEFAFPPEEMREPYNTLRGDLEAFIVGTPRTSQTLCLVMYLDIPKNVGLDDDQEINTYLDNRVKECASELNGKAIDPSRIKIGDNLGVEFQVPEMRDGRSARCRIYFANNRMYRLLYAWPREDTTGAAGAKRFLESFKLLPAEIKE